MPFQCLIKCLFEHYGATYKLQKYCKRPNKHHSPKPIVQFFNLTTADILQASHEMVLLKAVVAPRTCKIIKHGLDVFENLLQNCILYKKLLK